MLAGRRWEYPIPKSKEYWSKFCRDEERRLIVVRDPSVRLTYHSFPGYRSSKIRGSSGSENSLHELSRIKSTSRSTKLLQIGEESLPRSILKSAERKLDASRFDLDLADKENYALGYLGARNKPEARSTTLPALSASAREPKPSRSNRAESSEKKLLPKLKSSCSRHDLPSPRTARISEDSLKYSTRRAYKALRHVTANKRLNFDPETVLQSTKDPSRIEEAKGESSDRADEGKPEEFPRREESPKDSQFAVARRGVSRLFATSPTIPSGSRSTSGPSPRFAQLEPLRNPSGRVLSSIPELSNFPRGHRDKCLPCIYKSFEARSSRRTSFPVTTLHRIINSKRVVSPSDGSESSGTICLPDFEETLERMFAGDVKKVSFRVPSDLRAEEAPLPQERLEEASTEESAPHSERSCDAVTRKDNEQDRGGASISAGKSPKEAAKFERAATLERSKLSASFRSDSTEDEDSQPASIDEDQSRPKYLAPCHAATVLKPSLEPLRALRNRKATTLQDRIAFLESSSKKNWSLDDEAQEKQPKSGKPEEIEAEKSDPVVKHLKKAKSVPENLILENVERAKKDHVLRKGLTVAGLALLKDASGEQACADETEDEARLDDSAETIGEVSAPRLPLTDTAEVMQILQGLEEETPAASMLETLSKEFSERVWNASYDNSVVAEKTKKLIGTLTSLLVDSKRYLDTRRFPSDLSFSSNQPPPCNPQLLKRILPEKSYNLVAPLLGLPVSHPPKRTSFRPSDDVIDPRSVGKSTVDNGDHSLASFEVHPASSGDCESLDGEEKLGRRGYNPYALFRRKPRRKVPYRDGLICRKEMRGEETILFSVMIIQVITWRPLLPDDLEGYDPNATLKMRTDNIMSEICRDFCQWLNTLTGAEKTVDEQVLKDMFEVDFNAEACRAMQVLTREMPVVSAEVARTRNTLGASKLSMTKKQVLKDARAEKRAPKMTAFGTTIPWHLQFTPPKNRVRENWLDCRHVPTDLETMDVVWKGITNLKSVRGFVEWLQQHPEITPPDPLKELVATDVETLRLAEDDEEFAHLELDIYQIKSFRVGDTSEQ
nr:uncharacterized protein LOC117217821 isoform X1 [Megalopta genalis]XP_033321559.1 uncharacterized protein LOC117217821 isoform X1 [Megalopta genalis]